jgi:hypothetical protein
MCRLHAIGGALALLVASTPARAQFHRRFEPTDLELQDEGTLELDAAVGYMEGPDAARVIVPDFEVSLGLAPSAQLQIDGAFALEGPGGRRFSADHSSPDNLWISAKVEIADWRDDVQDRAWTLGAQLGPKLPIANDTRGPGYEAIALFGRSDRRVHVVLNLGGFVDPMTRGTRRRPVAIEGGVDVSVDLDAAGTWSLLGEIGAIGFATPEPHQGHASFGVAWGITRDVDLSVIGVVGFLGGGDRGGVLVGVTPRFALWK